MRHFKSSNVPKLVWHMRHRLATPDLAVWAQGQVKLAKVIQKPSTYDVTCKKPTPPNQKIFFRVQTTRLAESFELLTGSVVLTGPEKFPHKAMCDPAVFAWTAWINPGSKVLIANCQLISTKTLLIMFHLHKNCLSFVQMLGEIWFITGWCQQG